MESVKSTRPFLLRIQHKKALRVIVAYNTMSYEAEGRMLARMPPIELLTNKYRRMHTTTRNMRAEGAALTAFAIRALKSQVNAVILNNWRASLGAIVSERESSERSGA